jgi:hypothetical protein
MIVIMPMCSVELCPNYVSLFALYCAEVDNGNKKTPVIRVCQGCCSHGASGYTEVYQIGTFGGAGMPLGLIVNGDCVTCTGSSNRCVHKSTCQVELGCGREEG